MPTRRAVLVGGLGLVGLLVGGAVPFGRKPKRRRNTRALAGIASGRGVSLSSLVIHLDVEDPPPVGNVVAFTPAGTRTQFLALLADEDVDVIALDGTYTLPYVSTDIDRTRPVLIRPATGASATFSGANVGGDPQFSFGFTGANGNINFDDVTFDGYILAQQGIIQMGSGCHDMTFSRIVAVNSRCNGGYAQPYHSWVIYATGGYNILMDQFDVTAVDRQMSALAIDGGDNVRATNWTVTGMHFAAHLNPSYAPITNCLLDTWAIDDCGTPSVSVQMENSAGIFRNMVAVNSGGYTNTGSPTMTDGGGNSWS